ncbi:tripartite tricarboxylate transporter TctB family protein [Paracoccus yeei]|uniref:tripartite tricarboxylate transporter TctB family protein n=1 Tax=Paracoccus yeei TaxID=147645 RepID=UPI00048CD14E|nr:tripartite tricarboxylate transporter TctB family protein [Paracoccus yeei]
MNRRYVDVVLGSVLIAAAILILSRGELAQGGVETQLGSMFMPRVVAGFILIFSAMIAITSLRQIIAQSALAPQEMIATEGLGGVLVYVGIFAAYWWLLPTLGFVVTTSAAMFAIAVLLGGRSWFAMAVVSIIIPVITFYGCRELIRVYLPEWSL